MYFNQSEFGVRCEWGIDGLKTLAPGSDAIIIVDVLSFTTCVDIAVSRKCTVYPYAWRDEASRAFAESIGGILVNGSRRDPEQFSLAPSSLQRLPEGSRIVLPSINGARLSLAAGGTPTFAGCLRNAAAVAQAAAGLGRRISVIPSGERWREEGALRPGLEDLLGVGAIIHCLPGTRSPEAEYAEVVFLHFQANLEEAIRKCSTGKESADRGSPEDVKLASALNASSSAPRLEDGAGEHPFYQ